MRKLSSLAIVVISCCSAGLLVAGEPNWTQLSLSTCQVDAFLKANPNSDGRGVVIAVMDTGVDPGIPGLTRMPDGGVKVIDIQDFTGDGDVELLRIRLDAETGLLIRHDDDGVPIEYHPPQLPPADEERFWWFGLFKEKKFANSGIPDLNDNGQTDDEFPVLVTALAGDGDDQALCFIDTNLDRSFADERPLRNYRLNYDTFTLHRKAPEAQIEPLTFSVNIFLRQSKVVICFDEGAHGTHVAGIAAGYQINNQPGFNGVAPGAHVISLKIGKGALGGISVTGSKQEALRYAARYAREHNVQVVCNLSYGVDSEIEGNSDIDQFVDSFLRQNPYLIYCTSAGNSGPGLSTVGTPSAASDCIAVAALMAADTARDVPGWNLDQAVVTAFSSRGGELDKPDIATPGWCTSTVPRHVTRGDFWAGTSMASPYAAGLCANLISHAQQRHPGTQVRACDVRRALWLAAQPAPGATQLDAGWGVPDLRRAAEILDQLVAVAEDDPIISYDVSTSCPHGFAGQARTAYWRSTWHPDDRRQTFTITPVFAPLTDATARTAFTRKYELRSNTPWCRVTQESFYLRSGQSASVFVEYDPAGLTEPGLHVGTVDALSDGLVALRLVSTVIVPHRFSAAENYTRSFKNQVAHGWTPNRYFLAVPPGASAMHLRLAAPEGQRSKAGMHYLFDPRGKQFRDRGARLDTDEGVRHVERTIAGDLTPGVWELPILAARPDESWPYDLDVRFFGLHADPPEITAGSRAKPAGELIVTNMYEEPLPATADGQIEGYRLHKEDEFKGLKDQLTYSVKLDQRFNRLRLHLELTPSDYARITDIGVMVKDADGESLHAGAFDGRIFTATVNTRGKTALTVQITGGFALVDDQRKTPITVKIDQLFANPVSVAVKYDGSSSITFVPGVPIPVDYSTSEKLTEAPDGLRPVGFIRFRERATETEALRVLLDIGA
jgi:subtilisin family serine protease